MNKNFKDFAKGKPVQEDATGGYCIIYNRVSSKEQLDGQSLETQMEKCEQYAGKLGMTITEKFGGTFESAKSDRERKEFNRMLDFLKKSKKPIKAVIVYSTSRFSRTGSTTIIEEVEKEELRCVLQHLAMTRKLRKENLSKTWNLQQQD